ncbi:hypothetical protein KS4_16040 [Poriferisphaera corsica]|uniref:Uncharacterized protein n=1 Tax=Poriferisphaera corsica TaxID=2528020 RepID=A0A517YTJ3_9BACT|nr:hypothetical protein [Poriferisphaera corsica]QDU33553.1 hypothetical protein KS4_16040 [Poriferisphaera corsica]
MKRRGRHYGSANERQMMRKVAAYALPHRRKVSEIVSIIIDEILPASEYRKVCPFFTHQHISRVRGRQHRNTSREIIGELKELGLLIIHGYRHTCTENCTKFDINWRRVRELFGKFGLGLKLKKITDVRPGSAKAWREQFADFKKREDEAKERQRQERIEAAERERVARIQKERENAMSNAERVAAARAANPFAKAEQPCKAKTPDEIRAELEAIKAQN